MIHARLSDWNSIDEYDSQSACQKMRAKLIENMPGTEIDTALCIPGGMEDLVPGHEPGIADDLDNLG